LPNPLPKYKKSKRKKQKQEEQTELKEKRVLNNLSDESLKKDIIFSKKTIGHLANNRKNKTNNIEKVSLL